MGVSKKSVSFNCFSPPVMLATLTIESILAVVTLVRFRLDTLGKLTVAALISLAAFQLAEYHVCTSEGLAADWSRIGYVAITLLPALGLHIQHVLAGKQNRKLVTFCYVTMGAFAGYFLLQPGVFHSYACTGNYVIFQISQQATWLYSAYYYGWLLTAIGLGLHWAAQLKTAKLVKRLQSVQALVIGYLIFLVPTTVANTVKPETRSGIPSIMCGFAVLFAFILALYILPKLGERRIAVHNKPATVQ